MSKLETVRGLNDSGPQLQIVESIRTLQQSVAELGRTLEQVQSLEQLPDRVAEQMGQSLEAISQKLDSTQGLVANQVSQQVVDVQNRFDELRQTLLSWTQGFLELQSAHRLQMLDMAVLLEPIVPALDQIDQKQQQQEKILAKQDERLAKMEASMSRLMLALPSLVSRDGRQVQPRLASKDDLAGLPAKVWESKPGMFGKS